MTRAQHTASAAKVYLFRSVSLRHVKPQCSARTGRTVFSQLTAAVVRHKANDGAVYAI